MKRLFSTRTRASLSALLGLVLAACAENEPDADLPSTGIEETTDSGSESETSNDVSTTPSSDPLPDTGSDSQQPIAPEPFRFVVITDTHARLPGGADDKDYDNARNLAGLRRAVETIDTQLADAAFVAITGDLVGCLFSDDPDDYLAGQPNPAEEFQSIIDGLSLPVHMALGNHDYEVGYQGGSGIMVDDITKSEAIWKKVLGIEPYHSFDFEGQRFIFLNSARGPAAEVRCPSLLGPTNETRCKGSFDEEQLEWLEALLDDGLPSFLFFHHPVITDHNSQRLWSAAGTTFQVAARDRFYEIAQDYNHTIEAIFVGHGHLWESDTLNGAIRVFETGSIGDDLGAGNNIRMVEVDPAAGTFTTAKLP